MNTDSEEREDEMLALHSIFGAEEEFVRKEPSAAGEIRVSVELPAGFTVSLTEGETVRQYEILFLPPLLLTFELPEDYPSSSPPSFTLTSSWLTRSQLSALGSQLADLYQATGGAVVLFSWVQFLREDALGFLDIRDRLDLSSVDCKSNHPPFVESDGTGREDFLNEGDVAASSSSSGELDLSGQGAASLPLLPRQSPQSKHRTVPGDVSPTPSQALLSELLIYDAAQRQRAFANTVFDCGVCFVGWLGSECVQLHECGHVFCQSCLSEFCKMQITEGNIRGVSCPEASCESCPTPAQVQSLVGEELFGRYDRLLLQSTLDLMPDVTYCPRRTCGSPVILEKSGTAGLCSVCGFAFCVACKKTYHGAEGCRPKASLKELIEMDAHEDNLDLPQSQEGLTALSDDYLSGSEQRRSLLQSRYGRRVMKIFLPDILSEDWIVSNSKSCPHCYTKIEKNGGCNKMTCSRCRQNFCWLCLTRLTGRDYSGHFQDSACSIFQYDF